MSNQINNADIANKIYEIEHIDKNCHVEYLHATVITTKVFSNAFKIWYETNDGIKDVLTCNEAYDFLDGQKRPL